MTAGGWEGEGRREREDRERGTKKREAEEIERRSTGNWSTTRGGEGGSLESGGWGPEEAEGGGEREAG